MHHATIHAAESLLINLAPRHNRAARNIAAAQRLGQGDNVRLEVPMLKAKHFPGAAKSGLHFIGDVQRPVFAAKFLRANEEIGLRRSSASRSSSGTRASNPSINGPKPSVKRSQPINESEPWLSP